MYRIWGKLKKRNKIITDTVIERQNSNDDEAVLFEDCLTEMCREFDLENPMILPKNWRDYFQYQRVVFTKDNFIDKINFDNLEIEVLEFK